MKKYVHTYTVDFSHVIHYSEVHNIIRDSLDFPDYYGCNWSAFWDCLSEMLTMPLYIKIIGMDIVREKFGDHADTMIRILKRFKHCFNDELVDEIQIELIDGDRHTFIS